MSEIERLSSISDVGVITTASLGNMVDIIHPKLVKLVVDSYLGQFVKWVLNDLHVWEYMGRL